MLEDSWRSTWFKQCSKNSSQFIENPLDRVKNKMEWKKEQRENLMSESEEK